MKRINVVVSCAAAAAAFAVAANVRAIPVPDTGSTCSGVGECFKITSTGQTGIAIRGVATQGQSFGVAGSGDPGVYGTSTINWGVQGDGPAGGVFGNSTAANAKGVYGNATGTGSIGVYAHSAQSMGVYAISDSASSYSIYGISNVGWAIRGDGSTRGVHGQASAAGSIGVAGVAPSGSTAAKGTYGALTSAGVGTAVYGDNQSTLSGAYAGYFNGKVAAVIPTVTGGRAITGQISPVGPGHAIYGENDSANLSAFAGYFHGNIQVTRVPFCTGCTAFTSNSDSRLKKNIHEIGGALDQILKLHGVTFEWKNPEEHGDRTGVQRGFIAQEVEKVLPEWVGVDEKGFETLNLTGIEPMIVESIRSLKGENDVLRDRVKALEARQFVAAAGLNGNGLVGLGLIALAGAIVVSRRRAPNQNS